MAVFAKGGFDSNKSTVELIRQQYNILSHFFAQIADFRWFQHQIELSRMNHPCIPPPKARREK
jgi:hypothetical protein